jgi:hypothetical protein
VSLPGRLGRIGAYLLCALALVVAGFSINVPESSAGPAPGLCQMNTSRGAIPASFAIQACTDTKAVYLHNNLTVALTVQVSGDVGAATRSESDYGLAADATRLHSHDPWIILPGDTLRIRLGPRAASFRLFDSTSAGFYALATVVQTFMPGHAPGLMGTFTSLVSELNDDFLEYKECLAGKDWIGQIGCDAVRTRNVMFALARAGVSATAKASLSVVLAAATFLKWADAQVPTVEAVRASGTLTIAAVVPATSPTISAPPPTSPAPSSAPTLPAGHGLAVGSSFSDDCVIAWPTAPVYTTNSIQMTMSCEHVPEGEYLFTQVIYGDPGLRPTPDTGTMHVVGQVIGVARSGYGFAELEVQASNVTILGNGG